MTSSHHVSLPLRSILDGLRDGVSLTDVGLVHLEGLTNLKELFFTDTKVTDAGVRRLQDALPKCVIKR